MKRFLYWTLNSNGAPLRPLPVRFVSLRCFTSRRSLFASFSCAYIREVAPLQRDTPEDPPPLATKFLSTALLLRSSPSWLAVCTAGRDSRPPKPHLLSPVREKGDKVFGERSARLLTSSSRTPRTRTTISPTSTTSGFFVADAPDSDDYFPDVDNLLDDMEDTTPKSSASAPAAVTYVFLPFLLEVLLQFLVLVFALCWGT